MAETNNRPTRRFSDEFLSDLRNRVDGPAFIGRFVQLEQAGERHRGLCPFHKDSKPSFYVSKDGSYHCFGCQASGSVFSFIMESENKTFPEAVADVANYLGVALPQTTRGGGPSKEQLEIYDVLERALDFFQTHLAESKEHSPIRSYLAERALSDEIVDQFQLGYAPNSWNALGNAFVNDSKDLLFKAGLVGHNAERKSYYDLFRHRLIFPIKNRAGRCVGFGARSLDGSEPKYINTKQTPVFHKSRELYGLSQVLELNRRPERLLLVEGYMDVIALAQFGIKYAVAALGTASNVDHFRSLFWSTKEVVCCFDGDLAGRTAANRAMRNALPHLNDDASVRILFLPENEDPDTLVRRVGKAAFEEELRKSQHLADYFVSILHETEAQTFDSIEKKAQFVSRAQSLVREVQSSTMRKLLLQEIATRFPESERLDELFETDENAVPDEPWHEGRTERTVHTRPRPAPTPPYLRDTNSRRRVAGLFGFSALWSHLNEHRSLLDRLLDIDPSEPMTRVWQAIDDHDFNDVSALISYFQTDNDFGLYLADIERSVVPSDGEDRSELLRQFVESVESYITTDEQEQQRAKALEQIRSVKP